MGLSYPQSTVTDPISTHACRMFGDVYTKQCLARCLYDLYSLFPDALFSEVFRSQDVFRLRAHAAEALAKELLHRNMPEKLVRSIEADASRLV